MFPEFSIRSEDNRRYIADFFLQQGEEKLIIEIKNPVHGIDRVLSGGTEQLMNYLTVSGVKQGILYIPPTRKDEELEISTLDKDIDGKVYKIIQIYPQQRLNKKMQPTAKSGG